MQRRVTALFGSVVTLSGAFLVGAVLHRSLVRGEFSLLAPAGVFGLLGGVVLILAGYRLEAHFDPSEYVSGSGREDEEDDERTFDERLSPVPQERLERRDAESEHGSESTPRAGSSGDDGDGGDGDDGDGGDDA
jgi:hypothetical protein